MEKEIEEMNESDSQWLMTDKHRLTLQIFIAKKFMSDDELRDVYHRIVRKPNDDLQEIPENELNSFIATINHSLQFLFLEIRKTASEEDGRVFWGMVNAKNDSRSQIATSYGIAEIILFKKIILELVDPEERGLPEEGTITLKQAINLAREIQPPLDFLKAEETIKRLIADGWLCNVMAIESEVQERQSQRISVGIRFLLELKIWIEEVIGQDQVPECAICTEAVIRGMRCSNVLCSTKMHYHCLRRWFQGKASRRCPTCASDWKMQ